MTVTRRPSGTAHPEEEAGSARRRGEGEARAIIVGGRRTPAKSKGFTLMEVLIALAITAAMGAMMLGTFRQVDRAHELVRDQADRYGGARLALSRMAREVSMAFISDHFDVGHVSERPTLFVGKEDDLLFCTFAHERLARDARESDQAVVQYTLENDPDHPGERALFRREKTHVDEEPASGGRKDLVFDQLSALRFAYWDPKKSDWVREWSTRTGDHANDLPTRVRFELELKLPDGRTEKLSTEARIALTRSLTF
jgi:general secretion pathway protein J